MECLVVFEPGDAGWSAYVPDLPGCVAAGDTRDEVRQLMREAIPLHIAGPREDGADVPAPRVRGELVGA